MLVGGASVMQRGPGRFPTVGLPRQTGARGTAAVSGYGEMEDG